MAKQRWKLTDEQWQKIEPLLPKPEKSKRGGRPWADNRKVFEGILCGRQFCPGKKRGQCVGTTKRGKGTKWMVVVDSSLFLTQFMQNISKDMNRIWAVSG